MTKLGVASVAIVDVRRGHAVKRLAFFDIVSAQSFCDLCDLYAQESGSDFGSPDAYWLLSNAQSADGSRKFEYGGADDDGITTELDETVLANMIALLWSHRTGRATALIGVPRLGLELGGLTFGGAALPEMYAIRPGDAIIVIRNALPTLKKDADLKGIVVRVNADAVYYVRAQHVTTRGHIDKNASISYAAKDDVRFHPEAAVTANMTRELTEVCSYGDLLLRPIRYGAEVLLTAWARRQFLFHDASPEAENAKDLPVIYRGRMRDCTGAETDRGVMLEHKGVVADVRWELIASLKPMD
jgi:hypothetical protein